MNFIYFNPDEMRADALGCYGHPVAQTPNFDRLAAAGTRFDQCHVQHTVCSPSRCSFLTGWYPHTNGHRTLWHLIQPHEPNSLRYLKEAGWDVHVIGKNDALSAAAEPVCTTRIHHVRGRHTVRRPANAFAFGQPGYYSFLYEPMETPPGDYYCLEEALEFLRSRKSDDPPFFLFLSFSYPHCPYTCPEPWYSMYDPADMPPLRPAELEGKPDFYRLIREYRGVQGLDDDVWRKIMAVYLGMVSYSDHLFGRLLDCVEECGMADDTAIAMFSDHGDWAGDYGLPEKWPSGLDDCLTRVPMIWRVPGLTEGHVVHTPTECFDIVPTTLELAGVEPRHTHFASSSVPQLRGAAGDPDRAVYADGGYDLQEPHCFEGRAADGIAADPRGIYYPKGMQQQECPESVCRCTMLRTATHKLVWRPHGVSELYDLVRDPDECRNVFADPVCAEVRATLTQRLLDRYLETSDVVPTDADFRGFSFEK